MTSAVGAASEFTLAMDAGGHAIAAWIAGMGVQSTHSHEGGWVAPELVTQLTEYAPDSLGLAVQRWAGAPGDGVAIWRNNTPVGIPITVSRYQSASGWQAPEGLLPEDGVGNHPRVGIDATGAIFAVWSEGIEVHGRRFEEDAWTPDEELGATDDTIWDIALAVNGAGAASLAWHTSAAMRDAIYARHGPAASMGPALMISDAIDPGPNVGSAGHFGVSTAIADSGHAVASWITESWSSAAQAYVPSVVANVFIEGSGWTGATAVRAAGPGSVSHCVSAIGGDAEALLAWSELEGTNSEDARWHLNLARFDGTEWGKRELMATGEGELQPEQFALAMSDDGHAVLTWAERDSADPASAISLRARQFVPGLGWLPDQLVEADPGSVSLAPLAAIDALGRATLLWGQFMSDTPAQAIRARMARE